MIYNALALTVKLALASIAVGALLSYLDVSAASILGEIGLTPEQIGMLVARAFEWAVPNLILGAIVVLPIWLVLFLVKPPGMDRKS